MADFKELVNTLQNPGDDGLPETIYDDLMSSYDHDTSTRDAKIAELTELNTTTAAEVESLKAKNHDLYVMLPPPADGDTGSNGDTVEEVQGVDSLFESPVDYDESE